MFLDLKDAHSTEFNPETTNAIIDLSPEQKDVEDLVEQFVLVFIHVN